MRPFGLFGTQKVRPAWSYWVKGVIWHIHPAAGGTLIGEERRIEEKKAVFFSLDREDGRELWQHISLADAWWIGIEAVFGETVLFHGFANPNLPRHRGLIAVDVLTGKKLWEDKELEFRGIADGAVVCLRETSVGDALTMLDMRSGAKQRDLSVEDMQSLRLSRTGLSEEVKHPMPLDQPAAHNAEVEAAMKNHFDQGILAGTVEAVEHTGYLIFDCHRISGHDAAQNPIFSSDIHVVERATGTVAYSDTVCTGLQTVIPNLFFVLQDMLYYIKERRTLMAVRLAS